VRGDTAEPGRPGCLVEGVADTDPAEPVASLHEEEVGGLARPGV
jgi:hypothetical protein